MSAVDWVKWGVSVFFAGYLWTILNPVVQEIIAQNTVSTASLSLYQWMWNFGVLILGFIAPTVWVLMKYQKKSYKEY